MQRNFEQKQHTQTQKPFRYQTYNICESHILNSGLTFKVDVIIPVTMPLKKSSKNRPENFRPQPDFELSGQLEATLRHWYLSQQQILMNSALLCLRLYVRSRCPLNPSLQVGSSIEMAYLTSFEISHQAPILQPRAISTEEPS